jgi:hypothetical protein
MKRNIIFTAGTALVLALFLNSSQAQNDAPAPAPTAPSAAPAPGQQPMPGPRPLPPRARQPRIFVQRAVADLRQVKMVLQNSQEDFAGHKESAIEACDKALAELEAVMKAIPQPTPPQRPAQPPAVSNPPPAAPAQPAAPPQP